MKWLIEMLGWLVVALQIVCGNVENSLHKQKLLDFSIEKLVKNEIP